MTIREPGQLLEWLAHDRQADLVTIASMVHVALALVALYTAPAGWDVGLFLAGMTTWIFWLAPVIRIRNRRRG